MKKLKNSAIWSLIAIGVIFNGIFSFSLISASNAGHSLIGITFGYSLPILSLLLYLQYLTFKKGFPADKKERFWALTKPSSGLGIIIGSFLLLFTFMTIISPGIYLDFWEALQFFGFYALIAIVPNLILQFLFYLYLNNKIAKKPAANNK